MAPDLSVVIPTLNEEVSLRTLLPALKKVLAGLGVSSEIVVVDGGSSDGTAKLAEKEGARVIRQTLPGFGGAVREGLLAARGAHILEMDADGSHPPAMAERLWEARATADLVIASRYCPGGSAVLDPARRILSRALNLVSAWWLGWSVEDASSGCRIFRAAAVKPLEFASTDFGIQQETLAGILAAGGTAAEIPFRYEPRRGGVSKARVLPLALGYLKLLARLKLRLEGPRPIAALAGVLALALATGLCGVTWGLPGSARLRAFPERLKPTPEIAQRFADSWAELYKQIALSHKEKLSEEPVTYVRGVEEYAPGWDFPPGNLANAYRSLLLQSENPDEKKSFIILGQMRPWRLEFQPLYVSYGGAYVYPLGATLAAASALGAFKPTSDLRYFLLNPDALGRAYALGRLFVLIFQVGSVGLLFSLGRRLRDWRTGAWAALLFALCPAIVTNAHVLKPHPYSAFFCLASVAAMLAASRSGRLRHYLACGLCAGWAAGANVACVFFALCPLLAYLSRRRRLAAGPKELKTALLSALAAGLVLVATNPYLVASFKTYVWETTMLYPSTPRLQFASLAPILSSGIPAGMGWSLWLLILAGFAAWLWKPEGGRGITGLLIGVGFLFLWSKFWYAGQGPAVLRIYYPLIGLACLAAADAAFLLPRPARVALLLVVCADLALRSGVYLANMRADSGPDATRLASARWIEENVPKGATLGLTRYFEPAHAPFLRYDLYKLVIFDKPESLAGRALPDWLVVDQDGADEIPDFLKKNYAEAKSFPPLELAWARVNDPGFFANKGIRVYRKS